MDEKKQERMSTFELMAKLFESLAEEVIDKFGDEGKKAIGDAVFNFGVKRGQGIRESVQKAGEPLTFENYLKFYDMERSSDFKSDTSIGEDYIDQHITVCPLGNTWARDGMAEIGKLYCDNVDKGLAHGYDPEISYNLEKHILRDSDHCYLKFRKNK